VADVAILDVLLHGAPIGTITRFAGDRTLFAFGEAYIADRNRPTLSLGFKESLGGLLTDLRPVQTRLMPYFSNLLPEGHMRAYLAERAGVDPRREFFLLWALGLDLPGAIGVRAADAQAMPAVPDERPEAARDRRRGEQALRFSLAGVQLKFSAVKEARGGLTIPATGVGGSWIVKLPSREFAGMPENEYSMMNLARLIGIDVPPARLVDVDDIAGLPEGVGTLQGKALAVERFDRLPGGGTVHMEDFAQIFGVYPEEKYRRASYANIARVIGAEASRDDIAEFIRRLTFSVLIGNADMHLKNWSLSYPDRRRAALAPAYDLVSTIAYIPDRNAALNFSRTKRFDAFSEDELSHLAAKAMLPERLVLDTARATHALFRERWAAERKNLPLTSAVAAAIDAHLGTVPLGRK
jgi:serine/threonine-protein kinase HipA